LAEWGLHDLEMIGARQCKREIQRALLAGYSPSLSEATPRLLKDGTLPGGQERRHLGDFNLDGQRITAG
jgi:hypothetical protein